VNHFTYKSITFNLVILLAIGLCLSPTDSIAQADGQADRKTRVASLVQTYEPREFVGSNKLTLKYRLLKPIGYVHGKKYPLVLFLHGAGERGDDNELQLVHGAFDFADPQRRAKFPCYLLFPQCPNEQKWSDVDWTLESSELPLTPSPAMQSTKELVDEMIENAGVEPSRVYLTGLSMGGFGVWDAIARYPTLFAAAAPICGGGDPKTATNFSRLPIWCFHGDADPVVKVRRSREMVDALKSIGSRVQYSEYPGVEHDSWTVTYSNPKFYEWLFAQQKPAE
jgi:predicted peptidase